MASAGNADTRRNGQRLRTVRSVYICSCAPQRVSTETLRRSRSAPVAATRSRRCKRRQNKTRILLASSRWEAKTPRLERVPVHIVVCSSSLRRSPGRCQPPRWGAARPGIVRCYPHGKTTNRQHRLAISNASSIAAEFCLVMLSLCC